MKTVSKEQSVWDVYVVINADVERVYVVLADAARIGVVHIGVVLADVVLIYVRARAAVGVYAVKVR